MQVIKITFRSGKVVDTKFPPFYYEDAIVYKVTRDVFTPLFDDRFCLWICLIYRLEKSLWILAAKLFYIQYIFDSILW